MDVFWWFCKHFVVLHLEGVVFSTTLINSLFFLVFSVYQKKKNKTTPGLSFSLRSTIKAHIRLQSHLNFWNAGFIILRFRKRAWFYGIDSNSLACPDVLWEPWRAQTDEESFEFMRTWSQLWLWKFVFVPPMFFKLYRNVFGYSIYAPKNGSCKQLGFLNIFSALFHL